MKEFTLNIIDIADFISDIFPLVSWNVFVVVSVLLIYTNIFIASYYITDVWAVRKEDEGNPPYEWGWIMIPTILQLPYYATKSVLYILWILVLCIGIYITRTSEGLSKLVGQNAAEAIIGIGLFLAVLSFMAYMATTDIGKSILDLILT